MEEAAILRLASMAAAVIMTIIAAVVACASVRSKSDNFWNPILGFGFAIVIVFVGFRIFQSGYTWGNYL